MHLKKILGSFAYFLMLTGGINIDLNAQNYNYIHSSAQFAKQEYAKLCEDIQMGCLFFFIAYNDNALENTQIDRATLKKAIKVSRERMQTNKADNERVYYSCLALHSFLESKEIVGGIDIPLDFDIIEYGKGIEQAKEALLKAHIA